MTKISSIVICLGAPGVVRLTLVGGTSFGLIFGVWKGDDSSKESSEIEDDEAVVEVCMLFFLLLAYLTFRQRSQLEEAEYDESEEIDEHEVCP